MLQATYSICTATLLNQSAIENDSTHVKQIYVRNKQWSPPPASVLIENNITEFEKSLKSKQHQVNNKNKKKTLSNLTFPQLTTLRLLKNNINFVIKPTDKNLGQAIMETKTYTLQILKEHLSTNDYLQLSPDTAKNRMEDLKNLLKKLIYDNKTTLPSTEHQSSTASRKYTNNQ
jgi:hypothetical protein